MDDFSDISDDILGDIMSRLPSKAFASAACVSRLWNKISDLVLSSPSLVSGFCLSGSPETAVDEALEMALSKPIRPHFAIAFVVSQSDMVEIHNRISRKIGTNTILITTASDGIIGPDSITREIEEGTTGITIVIGFVPSLKVTVVPLLRTTSEPREALVNKILLENFEKSISGDTNSDLVGIMLFGGCRIDLKTILAKIDTTISKETVMIGDVDKRFICTGAAFSNLDAILYTPDAVALLFARDDKENKVKINFHVGISRGVVPMGPELEVIAVAPDEYNYTTLAVRPRDEMAFDGFEFDVSSFLPSIYLQHEDKFYFRYLGVVKENIPQDGGVPIKHTEMHHLQYDQQELLLVEGRNITRGDSCMLYRSDIVIAKHSSNKVCNLFNSLAEPSPRRAAATTNVFGGIVFASSSHEELVSEHSVIMPFFKCIPRIPFGGKLCSRQAIGRCLISEEEGQDEDDRFNMQDCNAVHLIMSYDVLSG